MTFTVHLHPIRLQHRASSAGTKAARGHAWDAVRSLRVVPAAVGTLLLTSKWDEDEG